MPLLGPVLVVGGGLDLTGTEWFLIDDVGLFCPCGLIAFEMSLANTVVP